MHEPLDLSILSSQLHEDFLNICISNTEAGAWYMLEVFTTDLFMNEPM